MLNKKIILITLSISLILIVTVSLIYLQFLYKSSSKPTSTQQVGIAHLDALIKILPKLEIGDVILRYGLDEESYIIAKVSHSNYSHVAIVASINPIIVIHATTTDDASHRDQTIQSSLKDFLSQAKNFAIVRYKLSDIDKEQISKFLFSQLGRPFSFSSDGVYCSLLVKQALEPYVKLNLPVQSINILGLKQSLIMPQAFFDDQNNTKVFIYD